MRLFHKDWCGYPPAPVPASSNPHLSTQQSPTTVQYSSEFLPCKTAGHLAHKPAPLTSSPKKVADHNVIDDDEILPE